MSIKATDILGLLGGLLGLLGDLLSDEDEENTDAGDVGAALARAGSVVATLMTEEHYREPHVFEIGARGAVKIQLAGLGINVDEPPAWIDALLEAFLWSAEAAHRAHWSKIP